VYLVAGVYARRDPSPYTTASPLKWDPPTSNLYQRKTRPAGWLVRPGFKLV
jgi:hypothetical protein